MSWRGEDWLRVPRKLPIFATLPSAKTYFASGHRPIHQAYVGFSRHLGSSYALIRDLQKADQTIKSISLRVYKVKTANRTCKG